MSHWSQEEGWWLASDGNWYPPTATPHVPWWRRPLVVLAAVIVVAALGVAAYVVVGTSEDEVATGASENVDEPKDAPSEPVPSPSTDASDGVLEDTTQEFEWRTYDKGDCVTWVADGERRRRTTSVVACEEPHRFEVSGSIVLTGDAFPSLAEWQRVVEDDCRGLNEALFGGPIDGSNSVWHWAILPLDERWEQGGRTVFCGLHRFDPANPADPMLVTGVLRHPG